MFILLASPMSSDVMLLVTFNNFYGYNIANEKNDCARCVAYVSGQNVVWVRIICDHTIHVYLIKTVVLEKEINELLKICSICYTFVNFVSLYLII